MKPKKSQGCLSFAFGLFFIYAALRGILSPNNDPSVNYILTFFILVAIGVCFLIFSSKKRKKSQEELRIFEEKKLIENKMFAAAASLDEENYRKSKENQLPVAEHKNSTCPGCGASTAVQLGKTVTCAYCGNKYA